MPHIGLRERKKQETRLALRAAALRLTAERGLDHVTVEDIAEAVDVSPRTFFNYFPSKEEAIIGPEPAWMEHVVSVIAGRPTDEAPLFSLEAVFLELTALMVDARPVLVMRRKVIAENPSLMARHVAGFVEFERVLVEAITHRATPHSTSDADSALVVAAAVAAMRVSVDLWVDADDDTDLSQLLRRAITLLAQGFGSTTVPSKGSKTSTRTTLQKDPS